jgi:hypothetical protein
MLEPALPPSLSITHLGGVKYALPPKAGQTFEKKW